MKLSCRSNGVHSLPCWLIILAHLLALLLAFFAPLAVLTASPGLLWEQGQTGLLAVPTPRAISGGVAKISAGLQHTMIIKTDDTLWGMGWNDSGQLGIGTASLLPQGEPTLVATGVLSVSAGAQHTMFIKTDGTLWGMGDNSYGQLGDGSTQIRLSPVQIATGVTAVAAGVNHTLFIKMNGTLWAMGANSHGELGDGLTANRSTPVQIATGVAAVSAANSHTLFIKTDGTLWSMGDNYFGQLGDGTTTGRLTPVQIATGVTAVSAGGSSTMFIKTDGTLWGMGSNIYGELGDGSTAQGNSPVQISTGVAVVAAGGGHTLFIKTDGTLWGMGNRAALGMGTVSAIPPPQLTPIQLRSGVSSVSAGWGGFSLFLKSDGTLLVTGDNAYGQLGDRQPLPGARLLASGVMSMAADYYTRLFVKSDGSLWQYWYGEISQVAGVSDVIQAIDGGYGQRRLYLKGDGTLWLLAEDGSSVQVASDVASAGAGLEYYVYLKSDGTLWGVGSGSSILFGNGVTPTQVASNVVSVSASGWHILFVKTDQTLWGMGQVWSGWLDGSGYNQFQSIPVQLETGVVLASASANAGNRYIKTDGTLWTRGSGWGASTGPAVQVDSDVLTASGGIVGYLKGSLYLKADGVLRFRSGIVGPLGSVVNIAGGVTAISGGSEGWALYLQTEGYGTAPVITTQPQAAIVSLGAMTTLQVTATGTALLGYRWFKDGVALPWAQSAEYVIPYVTTADIGTYTVTITNSAGSVTSNAVLLADDTPAAAAIITQPVSQSAGIDSSVTFTTVASGMPVPTYQWRKNGVNIGGATGSSYTIASVAASDAGSYTVVATNASGSATSNVAALTTFLAAPSNAVISITVE